MVLFRPGIAVSEARGSIGGQTFSRNRGGMYIRARATPTNTVTPARTVVRAQFANVSSGWRNVLNDVQRAAWDAWAELSPDATTLNSLGETIRIGGKAAYQRLNLRLLQAGMTPVTDPPTISGPAAPASPTAALTNDMGDVGAATLAATAPGAGRRLQLFMGPPVPPGATLLQKNQLRLIGTGADNAAVVTATAAYQSRYGAPPVGARVAAACRTIQITGQVSDLVEMGFIEVGTP